MVRAFLGIFLLCLLGPHKAWALKSEAGVQRKIQFGSGLQIDRIVVNGVKAFAQEVVEGALEVSLGDQLERLKIVRTEENLQSLYRHHGYDEVSIRSRLVRKRNEDRVLETILEFDIAEGRPVRISEVQILPNGFSDEVSASTWKRRERKIRRNLEALVGEIYDQDKVAEGKRIVQELLFSEEYVGAQVSAVVNPTGTNPPGSRAAGKSAARWISVEFHIDLGDRVVFHFRGNQVFTKGYLDNLVDEQRQLGLGKDYIGAIRTRVEEEYRSAGYARVEIVPYTIEKPLERRVIYLIREGPRVMVESVDFDGNSVFTSAELRSQFFSKASGLVKNSVYVEKDLQKAADLLMEWLKEKGYLSSKIVTINSIYLPKSRSRAANSAVRVLVYLYEGDQTVVQHLAITGAAAMAPDEIKRLLKVNEGAPLNLFAFEEGIESLKAAYREQGYLGFQILNEGTEALIQYAQENRRADIFLSLNEGPQYRVKRIEVEGLNRTQEQVIRRELQFKEGEILKDSMLSQSEKQLRRLGIFSVVNIRTIEDQSEPGYKIVRVSAQESDRGVLTWGPGFRNDLGLRAFGQLAYTNLWGMNHTASVTATVNRRFYNFNFGEGQLQVAYLWPWFLLPGVTFRPAVSIGQTQYINFAARTLTLSTILEKQFFSKPNVTGSLGYALERIFQFNAVEARDNQQLGIGTLTPRLSLDLRDNPLSPTSGFFSTVWLDLAAPFLGSQLDPPIAFYRFQFRSDYYLPVWKDIIWYISFRTGYEQNQNAQGVIPLIRQFALGGIGSLRGYDEQALNYQSLPLRGGMSYVNYRTQLDLPFAGSLRLAVFVDAANLLVENYSLGGLLYGTGFGFHYQTPVGPVSLDWGFKLNPPPNASPYVIHFSVGVI